MKHRRLTATIAVALVMSGQVMGTAVAEPGVTQLLPSDCRALEPTPEADIPQAWHLDRLDMPSVWELATGKDVKIAVIDTGVSGAGTTFYPDGRLQAWNVARDMTDEEAEAGGMDCDHGTAVASLIAAGRQPDGETMDTRTNFAGIAPDASIISYRVLSVSTPTSEKNDPLSVTVAAIRDAIAKDVDIINLSQAVPGSDPLIESLESAVNDALAAGIVVVAAAGNADPGAPDPAFPGAYPGVIAVGMSTRGDRAYQTSLPGDYADVGAPGVELMGLLPSNNVTEVTFANQSYAPSLTGTSFAAPIVSGVVALMLERDGSLTPEQVRTRLMETADPPPAAIPDRRLGHGIVNPLRALTGVTPPAEGNPTADEIAPPVPLPTAEEPDMVPAMVAVSVGVGALALTAVGLVAAIAIPRAVRRTRTRK